METWGAATPINLQGVPMGTNSWDEDGGGDPPKTTSACHPSACLWYFASDCLTRELRTLTRTGTDVGTRVEDTVYL
jgi:hypothetical protein